MRGPRVPSRPGGLSMTTRASGLWGHRDFMRLWAAQAVSSFGARIAREGLPMVAILTLHAGAGAMGLVVAPGTVAYALGGLLAGPLVDRAPKRTLMVGYDLGRALVMLAIPLAAVMHWLNLAEILAAL